MSDCIFQVALPGPFLSPLDYIATAEQCEQAQVGMRVKVPFRQQHKIGLLLGVKQESDYEQTKLKAVDSVIDSQPLFDSKHVEFLKWASHYYHEPIGEVVMAALPKRLRQGEPAEVKGVAYWRLMPGAQPDISARATSQQKLLDLLQSQAKSSLHSQPQSQALPAGEHFNSAFNPSSNASCNSSSSSASNLASNLAFNSASQSVFNTAVASVGVSVEQLRQVSSGWRKTLLKWQSLGWVEEVIGNCWQAPPLPALNKHPLNCEQQSVVDEVAQSLSGEQFAAFLLQGVTGSGKTEVYLAMIEQAIAQGKQVLVMVPEIGLTPQMVERFQAYLQVPVATLHSGMSDAQRQCAWQVMRDGSVSVLLGTRSAVFAPFKRLGLCILDEEHDLSYKQQDGFRYSARDLLIRRAAMHQIPVVLGSATPSLESLYNVKKGRFKALYLHQRAGKAVLPSIKVLDIRGEKIQEGVSAPLKSAMQSHLQAGNQVLLFLNRRGFAPVLMCHECGWQMACPSCDANMTYHQNRFGGYLQCHHCDHQAAEPQECPDCGAQQFVKVGQGTERLEETIQQWFPDKSVLRIDRDTTRLKGSMALMTHQAKTREADILLGTQMLAKGHDFPHVTLVGLLEIDQGLFSCDYRATERLAQLIMQVAGRAGRASKPGEVLIQSRHPQNPVLTQLITQGYASVASDLLAQRQLAQLPPYGYQILIRAEAHEEHLVREFLGSLKGGLEIAWQNAQAVLESDSLPAVSFWGPIAAPMLRRQGRYRYQLMLNADSRGILHQLLSAVEPAIYQSRLARRVRWSIDVDPQEML